MNKSRTNLDREDRFRALYADAYADVLRFAQRRVAIARAEDVTADVFLVLWRRIDEAPTTPDDLRAWLFGVARNCLLNSQRSHGRQVALGVKVADTPPSGGAADAEANLIAQRVDLAAAWRQLSDTDREALSLTLFDDLTSTRAGQVLGISPVSYRLRLLRARRALRHHLDTPAEPSPTVQMETQP